MEADIISNFTVSTALPVAPRPRPDAGYAFDKWVYEDGTPVDFSTDTVSEYGTVLIAQFIPSDAPYVPQQFTITFVAGANGTLSRQTVFTVQENDSNDFCTLASDMINGSFALPQPIAKAHYKFKEWQVKNTSIEETGISNYQIYEDTAFLAVFELDIPSLIGDSNQITFQYYKTSELYINEPNKPIPEDIIDAAAARAIFEEADKMLFANTWKVGGRTYTTIQLKRLKINKDTVIEAVYKADGNR